MQDKHKVTLYLPQELHRQLKVRSAVELEPMSSLAERAITFYLTHPETVEDREAEQGQVHRVYSCPCCTSSLVLRDGEMTPLQGSAAVEEDSVVERAQIECLSVDYPSFDQRGEGELVPC